MEKLSYPKKVLYTQGDPLAMPMYGLATIIRKLDGLCKQVWYADDSAAIGTIGQLHD